MISFRVPPRLAVWATAAVTAAAVAVPGAAQADPVTYRRLSNYNSGLTAHVLNAVAGQPVVQQPFVFATKGQWEENPVNGGTAIQFENRFSGLCLDVDPAYLLDGAAIVQLPCDVNDPTQWWFLRQHPALPVVHVWNAFTAYYLTVQNASGAAGARLVQTSYNGADQSQMWQHW
jgi:hypothetical protein